MTNVSIYSSGVGLQTLNWPLQSSQTVTKREIGTPTRLRTMLKLGKRGTLGITYNVPAPPPRWLPHVQSHHIGTS
jgi:hypothetical protein